jgi:site-specific DNA-adenine methylase
MPHMTTATKALRPFFTYFGGKWRAAPHYPAPAHARIVEPFAGAAGYSLRYPDREVTLLDADTRVATVWRYLIDTPADEIAGLPLYDGTWETTDDLTHLPDGARWLIGFHLNHGAASPCRRPSAWMRAGTHASSFWGPEIRERVAGQVERIRHWRVAEADYASAPDVEATWFVDPPYQIAGRHYRHHTLDYAALARWCQARYGQVIVCENVGATWLPFEPFRTIKGNAGTGRTQESHEAIWTATKPAVFDGMKAGGLSCDWQSAGQ